MRSWLMIIVLLVALAILVIAGVANAHSWYPSDCCSVTDCFPIEVKDVVETPTEFIYLNYHFDKNKVRISKDNKYHVCIAGKTARCIFIPQGDV